MQHNSSSTGIYEGVTNPDFRGQQRKGFPEEGIIGCLSQGVAKGRKREGAMLLPKGRAHVDESVTELWDSKEPKFLAQLGC